MVSKEAVESQLKQLGFNVHSWPNRAEIRELPHVLLDDEEINECVNGYYEGGFALLVATSIRVLLIDKKPLNYLTVEDLRFDMINEIDYSHRMMGAQIIISTGSKTLRFRSYNQPRLRKLISHVQHCMAESKKKESEHQRGQSEHLERINQQLQTYLLANYQSQQELHQKLSESQGGGGKVELPPEPAVKPNPELADYLYSQSLLRQYEQQSAAPTPDISPSPEAVKPSAMPSVGTPPVSGQGADAHATDLYEEGYKEIFGNRLSSSQPSLQAEPDPASPVVPDPRAAVPQQTAAHPSYGLEINPLRVAYAKLPMALRNRKFGRPSFHAHSHASLPPITPLQNSATNFFGKTPRPARP
jgi:hypothetical protein